MKRVDLKGLDLSEVIAEIRKVTRTTKGGRDFSFRVTVIVGDRKGNVGYGISAHSEVMEAKQKAVGKAVKNLFRVHLRENRTIYHGIYSKYGASKIVLCPAKPGTGIIAGGTIRKICDVLGVKDIVAKSYGSASPHVVSRNTLKALKNINSPKYIATKRNKKISEIVSNRSIG